MQDELRTRQMKDLVRLVRHGKENPQVYGLNTLMRSVVAEIVPVNPLVLFGRLSESLAEICNLMCERAAGYVIDRISKRQDINEDAKDLYVTESKSTWSSFALKLRRNVESQFPWLEQLIFNHIFTFQSDLFTSGFIRLEHQQDLDCTDLEGAKELDALITENEERLVAAFKKREALKKKKLMLIKAKEDLIIMTTYLNEMKGCVRKLEEAERGLRENGTTETAA